MNYPSPEPIKINDETFSPEEVIRYLSPHIYDARREQIAKIINRRTYELVPVIDQLIDEGNEYAVLRSAEAFGCQLVEIIGKEKHRKRANRVAMGADKWLDVERWESPLACIERLKSMDLQIVATDLRSTKMIGEVDFAKPTALVFGNEKRGVSNELLDAADHRVVVPMDGFVQSMNISVAASVCLYHVVEERRRRGIKPQTPPDLIEWLTANYYMRTVKRSEEILLYLRAKQSTKKELTP